MDAPLTSRKSRSMELDRYTPNMARNRDDAIVHSALFGPRLRSGAYDPAVNAVESDYLRQFKIRAADDHGQRSSASVLLGRMYATRGYRSTPLPQDSTPERLTLVATDRATTIGTMTVGCDSPARLLVDELFAAETDSLRRTGHKLCEFTKLAMDSVVRSKHALASLFHVAYIYSYRVMGLDSLLIEVNPRHVLYYQRMLGFRTIGEPRHNPRVNAPAVLLCLDLPHAERQIARFGGNPDVSLGERSLYPHFFSIGEEEGIVDRLKKHRQTKILTSSFDSEPPAYSH